MKPGDLVVRKIDERYFERRTALRQRQELGYGLILTKQMAGQNPAHPCITVFYPKTGQVYDIAESLMEIL